MFHLFSSVVAALPVQTVVEKTTTLQPVVQPVAQTPAVTLQLIALGATAVVALAVSLFHQALAAKVVWLKDNANRIITAVYTVGIALVAAYSQGKLKLDTTGYYTMVVSFAVALATALGRYNLVFKFFTELSSVASTVSTQTNQVLATETAPAEPEAPTANF